MNAYAQDAGGSFAPTPTYLDLLISGLPLGILVLLVVLWMRRRRSPSAPAQAPTPANVGQERAVHAASRGPGIWTWVGGVASAVVATVVGGLILKMLGGG